MLHERSPEPAAGAQLDRSHDVSEIEVSSYLLLMACISHLHGVVVSHRVVVPGSQLERARELLLITQPAEEGTCSEGAAGEGSLSEGASSKVALAACEGSTLSLQAASDEQASGRPYNSSVAVDLTFNNSMAVTETSFFVDTIGDNVGAKELFIWLKHWTKAHRINEPKGGSLSSFGWRCILLSMLVQATELPCLREGMAALLHVRDWPCALSVGMCQVSI